MSVEPLSDDAKNTVWAAYEALDEKQKREITRFTVKANPYLFDIWMQNADLPSGYYQKKVVNREGTYGVLLDRTLKEHKDGLFAKSIFEAFLTKTGTIDAVLPPILDNIDIGEFNRLVDDSAAKLDSKYAALTAAFVKCYLRKHSGKVGIVNSAEREMTQLVERLNEHAMKLETWAESLRLAKSLPQDSLSEIANTANKDVEQLTELIKQCCEATGCRKKDFNTAEDVKEYVKELCNILSSTKKRSEISAFLQSLANAVQTLKVNHRLAKEEIRLINLRNNAANEIYNAANAKEPHWAYKTDKSGTKWLRWAFEIKGDELELVHGQLKDNGYESLSELITIGIVEWINDQYTSRCNNNIIEENDTGEPILAELETSRFGTDKKEIEVTLSYGVDKVYNRSDSKEKPLLVVEENSSIANTKIEMENPIDEFAGFNPEVSSVENTIESGFIQNEISDVSTTDRLIKARCWESEEINETSKTIADVEKKLPVEVVSELAGKLALQKEYSLAYHLILNASQLYDMKGTIPAWVYGSVACGSAMQGTDQSVSAVLQGFFQQYDEQLFNELRDVDRLAGCLLVAAGGIEPALLYPITGAASILQTMNLHKLPALQTLVKAVAEYGSRGTGLPRTILFSTISADELRQKQDTIQAKAKEWLLERAPQFEIISRPGKETWRLWISKGGPVGDMLKPIITGQTVEISKIRILAAKYVNDTDIDCEARRLFRNELKHNGELLRPALNMLRRHTAEAIQIVNEWISIVENQPDNRQRFDEKMLAQLRKCFADHAKEALIELGELYGDSWPVTVRAGALACARVVDDISEVLKGSGKQSSRVRNVNQLLNDDLLRVPMLRLDASGLPRMPDYLIPINDIENNKELSSTVVDSIMDSAAEGLLTMQSAAKVHGELGDHEATGEILKILENTESPDILKRLEQERTSSIMKHRDSTQSQLKQAQRALSDALTKGLFATQEYERWAVQQESANRDFRISGFLRFADVYALCDRLKVELSERKTSEIARLRKEIERINPSREQRIRIDAVLDIGDVHTATDYLDRIRNQIELPDARESESDPFLLFFGKEGESACKLIEHELRGTSTINDFLDRIAKRKRVPGLQLSEMQATQAKESSEFLQRWFKIKANRKLEGLDSSTIFNFLGMRTKKMIKVTQSKGDKFGGDVWDLQVEPLETRDLCPSVVFGSMAQGRYKVVCYWLRPAAEDILQHARELGGGPFIVLYFGRMDMAERRSLAVEQGRGDVIVIDDILAVFLSGQRKERLLSMFLCSLPFAHLSPYTKAASLLPPEMFYGRHREILQLMSEGSDSSCLLYGGRQIGKTVLLRHVQRLFERSAPNMNVATYIDLKGKEIGTNRPMDEVWLVIAEELTKKKVITEQVLRQTKHEWLFTRIERWLAENARRRILILLDEADAFLAADAKGQDSKVPFSACTVLKDLMERTNRRFKLVFAGLHNVQKSTKVSNNPLAHFGEPICIGAMTDAGESREAEALITEPLAAAGYFFESADLPARILAQTNYYPNLIQIYCDELLKYMQQRSRVFFPPDKTPPYIIGAKILEEVYERQDLREQLRLRFKWTLELDRRFELIANILALNDGDCTRGLEVAEIRQNVQLYWERGFRTNDSKVLTYEGFRDMLEEMVGLGILRRAEPLDHYALRNPNVLNLIGSRNSVERLLEDAHKWEPVEVYDPTKFRGQISESDKALRSPLNAAQESKLKSGTNQVCIVCGCPAGHVDRVEEAIDYRFGRDEFVRVFQGHEELSQFQLELSKLGDRKSGGTTMIVVPDSVRWDRNWIMEASKRVSRFQKAKGAVCVVFITGPIRLFSIVNEIVRRKFEGVNFTSIQPWDDSTVNQWLQEGGKSAVDARVRARLADITGNWPVLLEEAMRLVNSSIDDVEIMEKKVNEGIFKPERRRYLYELFGLLESTLAPLRFLCENGSGWSIEEINELLGEAKENISIEHLTNVLTWAELLGLAQCGLKGWELDAGVRQVLSIG